MRYLKNKLLVCNFVNMTRWSINHNNRQYQDFCRWFCKL